MTAVHASYAVGTLRDQFLAALDGDDAARSHRLATQLVECRQVLPGIACDQIGVPRLSTYAFAAQAMLSGECEPCERSPMPAIAEG